MPHLLKRLIGLLSKRSNQKVFFICTTLFLVVAIFYSSSVPNELKADGFSFLPVIRKIAHLFVYGLLYSSMFGLYRSYGLRLRYALFWPLILTALYGLTDEWHQSFIPGRTAHIGDVAIDVTGALITAWIIVLSRRVDKL